MSSRNGLPASSSMTLHGAALMEAGATPSNNGAIGLVAYDRKGDEVFDLTIFTGNGAMARELEIAINGVLLKHGRLHADPLGAVG